MRPSIAGLLRALLLVGVLASPLAHAQQVFATPEAAADAFTDALRKVDRTALGKVLGANYKQFIKTDGVERSDIEAYLAAWDKQHKVNTEGDKALIAAGDQGWTLPIPIVKRKAGWQFDVAAGADEMRTRRIGRNELMTIKAILAYYDAQREYAAVDHNGDGVYEYARKMVSTKGKKDGLYWDSPLGIDESPLGPLLARQQPKGGSGYYGYRYKILTGQGKDAPGGAYDYIIGNRMRSGFAAVAWPVRYGDTGVMTFMVSHAGIVYEKDLGPNSAAVASAMTRFNPDASWKKSQIPQ
ncbi:MAG TPA: DUF2950 domain-containing protein [Burkholderiaceae bacterium]|nr:DUF2950 domain-containing protein [Burkholderiaceae bacterium]